MRWGFRFLLFLMILLLLLGAMVWMEGMPSLAEFPRNRPLRAIDDIRLGAWKTRELVLPEEGPRENSNSKRYRARGVDSSLFPMADRGAIAAKKPERNVF